MKSKWKLFFPCYFAFFVNGAMVLLVGAILPYLIEEAGISYSVADCFRHLPSEICWQAL